MTISDIFASVWSKKVGKVLPWKWRVFTGLDNGAEPFFPSIFSVQALMVPRDSAPLPFWSLCPCEEPAAGWSPHQLWLWYKIQS